MKITNLTKRYSNNIIFENFSLDLGESKVTAILGKSGCGKTTLLNIIAGITKYEKGSIEIESEKVAYIFQDDTLLPWKTVYGNLEFILDNLSKDEKEKKIEEVLKLVKLDKYKDYKIDKLSGGMKQRVNIARALLYDGDVLLMDEPFKALDSKLKDELMKEILDIVRQKNKKVIFVTHNHLEAYNFSDEVIVLDEKPLEVVSRFKIEEENNERKELPNWWNDKVKI